MARRLTKNPSPTLESTESSSPIVTRAVAAGLQGRFIDSYIFSPLQHLALEGLGVFPQRLARAVLSRAQSYAGVDPDRVVGLEVNDLARQRLEDYAAFRTRFPCLVVGAALGGAAAHLSLTLGGPFLPQAFVVTLRGGAPNGNVQQYFQRSAELALDLADRNTGILTVQHYDPVHDGWVTRYANHLRFKLLDLPPVYAEFIRQRLLPGGALAFLDCGARWLRYRVGERSVFQVGGWGGIPAQEFLEGSQRLRRYCRTVGLGCCDWGLEEFPLESGPESEWGCEPGLGAALAAFCQREGYRYIPIRLPEPHDYSRLAFHAAARLLQKEGRQPAGVLIEMFSQFDATAVRRGGLLPLWLVFNTRDSLEFLREIRPELPADKPVFFSPLSTFSLTPDLVPWPEWQRVLEGLDWRNIGARPSHYPADARTLVHWADPLRRWVAKHGRAVQSILSAEELSQLATYLRSE